MAHPSSADTHATHSDHAAMGEVKEHPTWSVYWKVAVILTVLTAAEVWVYYIPGFFDSNLFIPTLLILAALKFIIVVLFYMHLRYDHRLFRALFTGPLIIAMSTMVALLFLFGHLVIHTG